MTIPRPTKVLDFTNSPLVVDPYFVHTRASTGVYVDALGVLRYAPANTPRIMFDPVSGLARGLLMEDSRTNLLLWSEDLTNAAWTKANVTITGNSAVAPDGATTMDTIVGSGAAGYVNQAVAITSGNPVIFSGFFKAASRNFVLLQISDGTTIVACWFNLTTGVVGVSTAGAGQVIFNNASIRDFGNGIYRCSLTCDTTGVTAAQVTASPAAADGATPATSDSIYAWGLQVEAPTAGASSTMPTSYIPTTTATVTRSFDSMIAATLTPWFNTTEGTLLMECCDVELPTLGCLGGFGGTVNDTLYWTRSAGAIAAQVVSGGVSQANRTVNVTWGIGQIQRTALAWKVNDVAFSVNGGAVATDTSNALPTVWTRATIGHAPWATNGRAMGGCIRRWAYYPRRISNALLPGLCGN